MTEKKELKPGWRWVKFGDVVRQVKDKVDPKEEGTDRYVAGEHMDTDDLRIRRWGEITDDYLGPAFHMRFQPGQVLYGSRRTYLRKVAVPDFEGVCANTTFVLESADEEVLLPDLLPFIMSTEVFHEHSIEQSKGSVNPYVNFSDLAWYEFPLPPLSEQAQIVKLLQACEEEKHALEDVQVQIEVIVKAYMNDVVEHWQQIHGELSIDEVLQGSPDSGNSAPARSEITGHWVLALNALTELGYVEGELKPVERTDAMESALLKHGDLLISRSNTRERVGYVGIYTDEKEGCVSFPDTVMRLNPKRDVVSAEFLELVLQSPLIRQKIMSIAAGTSASMKKINRKNLLQLKIPVPPSQIQEEAIARRLQFRQAKKRVECHLASSIAQYRHFLNNVLT